MIRIAWAAALALLITAAAPAPYTVQLALELGERPAGRVRLSPPLDGGNPLPLLDRGDVPFRAWAPLRLRSPQLRHLSTELGVGFAPTLSVSPSLGGPLGASGTLRFEGVVRVERLGPGGAAEELLVEVERGFDTRLAGAQGPIAHRLDSAPWSHELTRLPYRWTIRGEVTVDSHLYGPPQ